MELKLKPGDVFRQRSKTTQEIEQKMMGMSTKISQTSETYVRQDVIAVSPEGVADLRLTYERMVSSTESMMGKQTFDSQKDTVGDLPDFAVGMGGMVGSTFEYSLDRQGKVKELRGIDSLLNRIYSKAGIGEMGEEIQKSMKSMFGDDAIKGMLQNMSAQYPASQIKVGDTWGGENSVGGQFGLVVAITYKLESIEADKLIVSTVGEISTNATGGIEIAGVKMDYKMTGSSDGTMEIDRKTGMPLNSKVTQHISGSMNTMGMNVPMKIDQTIEVMPY